MTDTGKSLTEFRVHVTGAAGTGQTTLGQWLAEALGVSHADADDAYWAPSDPPYTIRRPTDERRTRLARAAGCGGWVISGALMGWGDPVVADADLTVFLAVDPMTRLARLKARERRRFGARIAPGGDMERIHAAFMNWAAGYDEPTFGGRSIVAHRSWLAARREPVLHLNAAEPVETLCDRVLSALATAKTLPGAPG